jgi:hypothetical protein
VTKDLVTRQKQYRDRIRRGRAIFRIEADEAPVLQALLNMGWLTPDETLDRRLVHEALGQVLADWAQQGLKK